MTDEIKAAKKELKNRHGELLKMDFGRPEKGK
jgi:hypothetical protein